MPSTSNTSSALANTRKVTQIMVICAVLILLAGGGGLYILNNMIVDAQKREAAKLAEVGSNKQIASRYQTALDNFSQTQAKLQYLEASVPEKSYVPTLLEQLQSLAKSTNLTVNAVHPGAIAQAMAAAPSRPGSAGDSGSSSDTPAAPPKQIPLSYSTMGIQLQMTGTYAHIMRFLYDLPRFPKILSVQSVQLHPGDGNILTASMQLTAYIFDPSQDVQISKPLQKFLQSQPGAPIAGANVQAAAQASGVMTPEARAIGIARNDAANGNEQATGQGILTPASQNTGSSGATPTGNGGIR